MLQINSLDTTSPSRYISIVFFPFTGHCLKGVVHSSTVHWKYNVSLTCCPAQVDTAWNSSPFPTSTKSLLQRMWAVPTVAGAGIGRGGLYAVSRQYLSIQTSDTSFFFFKCLIGYPSGDFWKVLNSPQPRNNSLAPCLRISHVSYSPSSIQIASFFFADIQQFSDHWLLEL